MIVGEAGRRSHKRMRAHGKYNFRHRMFDVLLIVCDRRNECIPVIEIGHYHLPGAGACSLAISRNTPTSKVIAIGSLNLKRYRHVAKVVNRIAYARGCDCGSYARLVWYEDVIRNRDHFLLNTERHAGSDCTGTDGVPRHNVIPMIPTRTFRNRWLQPVRKHTDLYVG